MMTEEKAVKTLETVINIIEQDGNDTVTVADIPVLKMAIDALNERIKMRTV
jgi:hypothetical protein